MRIPVSETAQDRGQKNIYGVGGFPKILRNLQSGSWQMLTSNYKVGGWGKKKPLEKPLRELITHISLT